MPPERCCGLAAGELREPHRLEQRGGARAAQLGAGTPRMRAKKSRFSATVRSGYIEKRCDM